VAATVLHTEAHRGCFDHDASSGRDPSLSRGAFPELAGVLSAILKRLMSEAGLALFVLVGFLLPVPADYIEWSHLVVRAE